ncbi:MAG: hypothetical protein JXR77_15590, partial [Lentisphaeria bacterium]|nr:hypothetical protein [Lentisphaeria bacterium]
GRLVRSRAGSGAIAVVGDSVVWGHYVRPAETLSTCLAASSGGTPFANLGVDGIHPAAMEGLLRHHARALSGGRLILHCNLLWMSSEKQDLQSAKEFAFNHPDLVPQFRPRIPCFRRSLSKRLGTVVHRLCPVAGWARHLRIAYFEGRDLPAWTVDHPYANPLARLAHGPPEADDMPSPPPVREPWTRQGYAPYTPKWVDLEGSLQWRSFQRTVELLRRRGNRVLVIVGPFNEHMLTPAGLAVYRERQETVRAWLRERGVPHVVPGALPSAFYADASHPLAAGYEALARSLVAEPVFAAFCGEERR